MAVLACPCCCSIWIRPVRVADIELRALAFLARRTVPASGWELATELRTSADDADRILLWLHGDGLVERERSGGWSLVVPAGLERLAKLRQMSDDPVEW